jgi:hypothetical protein
MLANVNKNVPYIELAGMFKIRLHIQILHWFLSHRTETGT